MIDSLKKSIWWPKRCVDNSNHKIEKKQGRIHGNPVADGWAGAVMRKPLANQKSYRPTYRPTNLHGKF